MSASLYYLPNPLGALAKGLNNVVLLTARKLRKGNERVIDFAASFDRVTLGEDAGALGTDGGGDEIGTMAALAQGAGSSRDLMAGGVAGEVATAADLPRDIVGAAQHLLPLRAERVELREGFAKANADAHALVGGCKVGDLPKRPQLVLRDLDERWVTPLFDSF